MLFDLDGTLADTIPLIVASYQHAFRTVLAEEVEEARARAWIGRPLLPALLEESPDHGHELDRVYREWNLANTARLIRRYAGVPELLDDLDRGRGAHCAVATSKRRETARLALRQRRHRPPRRRRRGARGHRPRTSRRPTRCCTPPPRWASTPADCVYVGDATVDVLAARAAGMAAGGRHLGCRGARGPRGHRPGRRRRHRRATSRRTCSAGRRRLESPPCTGRRYEENKHTELAALADAVMAYAEERVRISPPLDQPMSEADLDRLVGQTITAEGFGGVATMRMFAEDLAPTCLSTDHPRYLSFIPCAPSDAAVMFDLVVGASSIYAGSWLEGSGAVYAENQALRWIADLVGMPAGAGGVFTPGGTIGNLSALVAARHTARRTAAAGVRPNRVAATAGAHSSISSACDVMDAELVGVPVDERVAAHRAQPASGARGARPRDASSPSWPPAARRTSGSSTTSPRWPRCAASSGIWFHVDGAYGGAGLAAPSVRDLYAGIEHCDSFIVDPHKWLFAPVRLLRAALPRAGARPAPRTPRRPATSTCSPRPTEWNPTDYSVGPDPPGPRPAVLVLARRQRHRRLHRRDRAHPRRRALRRGGGRGAGRTSSWCATATCRSSSSGGSAGRPADYQAWSDRMLAEEFAFVVPTTHDGETLARFAIVNPETSEDDITAILDTMG